MRLKLLAILFLLGFLAVTGRLFYWQVLRGKDLAIKARGQYETERVVSAPRGNILASDGSWLAARAEGWFIYASLTDLKQSTREIADTLAPFFVEDPQDHAALLVEVDRLDSLLSKKDVVWVPLKHKVTPDIKKKMELLKISGIGFEPEETRVYPEASVAAHLLGFVGKNEQGEDIGYFGLEGYYNLPLSGKPGFLNRENDASGIPILLGESSEVSAVSGVDLLTHIDKRIQLTLERKLVEGIEKYGAKAGTAIVMRPNDGAILAASSFPSFDPMKYYEFGNELFKDPSVSEAFEPGSIFKVIVMAAALDANVIGPNTKCDICSGPLKVDKYKIETWNKEYYPDSTMTEVIVHSDNVGMAFVGQKLGADSFYNYLDKFGFGKLSGVDLQGEFSPKLRDKETWNIVDLATASFGQGVAVTPIQMIRAVSVLANGGVIVTPQVIDKLVGEDWEEDVKPRIGERVISQEASDEIVSMMVEAARNGESKWTNLRGFPVAGKTGTAQIPISGHYDDEKTIASFVGFAPYDKPKFVMLVTLKEPQTSPWASETAAPLWYSIARDLFPYFGVQPEN